MADQYVDKNLGNDANAGTSWGTGNAVASVKQAITNSSSGDTIYIRSYGPDDVYDIGSDELVPAGQTFIGCEGADSGTDPGHYAYVWIISSTDDVDIFDSSAGGTFRYIVGSATGSAVSATVRAWNLDGSSAWTVDHCRDEASTEYGFRLDCSGAAHSLTACESYNSGLRGFWVGNTGSTYTISHCVGYSAADYCFFFDTTLDAGAAVFIQSLGIADNDSTSPVWVNDTADFAAGSPDFNAFDVASGVTAYGNAPSPTPANDIYSIDAAQWLPAATYGILRLAREAPGVGAGWPNGQRREDIGIDGEYVSIVEAEWSGYEQNGTTEGGASYDMFGLWSGDVSRAQLKFYLGGDVSETATVQQAWLRVNCLNMLAADEVNIVTYGDDGYTYDPEQDSLSDRHLRSAGGTSLARGKKLFDATGELVIRLESPSVIAAALGHGRRFSIAINSDGDSDDVGYISAYDDTDVTKRPRLILVYTPAQLAYRGGEEASLASMIRDYAELMLLMS